MDHPQTPRVLQPHLQQFQHRIVRVLGKVVQLRGENAVIDAGGQIDVILNRVSLVDHSNCRGSLQPRSCP
jgi:replication factor A3